MKRGAPEDIMPLPLLLVSNDQPEKQEKCVIDLRDMKCASLHRQVRNAALSNNLNTFIMFRNILLVCLLVTISACRKDAVESPAMSSSTVSAVDRDKAPTPPLPEAPVYKYYPGGCKMSLRIYSSTAFGNDVLATAKIKIRGANINGAITFFELYTTIYNQNNWVVVDIPESAHIFITVLEASVPFGSSDYLTIQNGEFGFNRRSSGSVDTWNTFDGFFMGVEQPVFFGKFPPYNSDTRYECASWCTWAIRYQVGGDPLTQDGPNFQFRAIFAGTPYSLKTFGLSPNTTGVAHLYPLTYYTQFPLHYQCEAFAPAQNPPPFCYDLWSSDITNYPPNQPAPIPPSLQDITYGLTPVLTCDAVCKMQAKSEEYPHCQ